MTRPAWAKMDKCADMVFGRHADFARQFPGGNADRLSGDEEPECLQAGRLRKGGKRGEGQSLFHISRILEIIGAMQVAAIVA